MKTKVDKLVTFFYMVIVFILGYGFGQSNFAPIRLINPNGANSAVARAAFDPFWEIWDLVNSRYYDQPVDPSLLVDGAIRGMLDALDDSPTAYRSPEEQARFMTSISGEFEGIGAQVSIDDDGNITIVTPLEGSPAEAAGILPGDIVRRVDGEDITGMTLNDTVALIRGPLDSTVVLTIERADTELDITITRGIIKTSSVRSEMLDDGIAYLRLNQFGDEQTVADFDAQLADLMAQNPVGLILDLRRNPGGLLTTAVAVGDHFLPAGDYLYQSYGDGTENVHRTTDEGLAENIPLVVLIDAGSASSSEVFANAIRDYERGILIGQTSFGKGTVQSAYQLGNGGGVSITVARWLSPQRHWVQDSGIDPDYFIPLPQPDPDDPTATLEDSQRQAAIDFLLGRPIESIPPVTEETDTP